jgi:hypothetical protein
MARKFDLKKLKREAIKELDDAKGIVAKVEKNTNEYIFARWVCRMVAVDIYESWENYVENRLAAGLNHAPEHFLETHDVKGVKNISSGFAYYIVRGGGRFFDFRSVAELVRKGNEWLGKQTNPFLKLSKAQREYIDALAAIRNYVSHGSDAANRAYRWHLKKLYGIQYAMTPGEFLLTLDRRPVSHARGVPAGRCETRGGCGACCCGS